MNNDMEEISLLEVLSQDARELRIKSASSFDKIAGPFSKRIVLFGAGGLGKQIARGLIAAGITPIAFADNGDHLRGQNVMGIPVYTPEEAASEFSTNAIFVVAIWRALASETMQQRKQFLKSLGCERVCSVFTLFWKYSEVFLPYYCADWPDKIVDAKASILKAFDLLADQSSKQVLVNQIAWRLDPEQVDIAGKSPETEYFPGDLIKLSDREAYVDCGGYDGDTAKHFIQLTGGRFSQIHVVEPDPNNYVKIKNWTATLPATQADGIFLHNIAVSDVVGSVCFAANSAVDSKITGDGEVKVACDTLDNVLAECRPSLIKMDIEGAEVSAVRGALGVIARARPILSICLYHNQSDCWEIPLLVSEHIDDYRYFVKNHGIDGWDLVMYAIPAERLISG